jgi:hypothetical protein
MVIFESVGSFDRLGRSAGICRLAPGIAPQSALVTMQMPAKSYGVTPFLNLLN